MQSKAGQIIITAAFLDDIFSIICLVIIINLAAGDFDPVEHTILPLIQAFALVIGSAMLSISLVPPAVEWILRRRPWMQVIQDYTRAVSVEDELHLSIMFGTFLIFSWIGDFIGSALLGSFAAGMLFSSVPRSNLIWARQFKRAQAFLLKLFFGATIAFAINIGTLFTVEAFWKGLVMTIVPTLATKLFAAYLIGDERWVVGIALMARGEFGYLVGEAAHSNGQLTDTGFAIVIWALLWATIVTPILFGPVLYDYIIEQFKKGGDGEARAARIGGGSYSGESTFIIRLTASHRMGMVREICDALHSEGLDVLQSNTESDGIVSTGTFVVIPREAVIYKRKMKNREHVKDLKEGELRKYKIATDLDDEKLDQISGFLKETLNDEHAVIIFEATEKESEVDKLTKIEVKLFGDHTKELLCSIVTFLKDDCDLTVRKEIGDSESTRLDQITLYCWRKDEDKSTDPLEDAEKGHSKHDGIQIPRNLSNTSIIQAVRNLSTSGIRANRQRSNTNVLANGSIQVPRQISSSSVIQAVRNLSSANTINVKRDISTASIVLKKPENFEKTIEIIRRPTGSSLNLHRPENTHAVKEILSTFTAEQRDFIREGIRNIYTIAGVRGAVPLVKMIHDTEIRPTIDAAAFFSKANNEEKENGEDSSVPHPLPAVRLLHESSATSVKAIDTTKKPTFRNYQLVNPNSV